MFQEILAPSGGRLRDTISVFSLLIAVIAIEVLGAHLNNTLAWVPALVHLVAFAALVTFCALFYRIRLTGFRYTLFTNTDADSEQSSEKPAANTFIAERTVGDVGNYIDIVEPHELRDLVPYDGSLRKTRVKRLERATRLPQKTASVLIYYRDGAEYGLIIHPSEELTALLTAAIDENTGKAGLKADA